MQNLKRIPLQNMFNCRDLGGYACENGGMISYHKVLRSDCPVSMMGTVRLSEEEWKTLYDYGVRTVIDLRSTEEIAMSSYEAIGGIEVIAYPMQEEEEKKFQENGKCMADMNPDEMAKAAGESFGKSLTEGYVKMVEGAPKRIAEILNIIGEKLEKGGVLFHCTAGKDRTGVTAALIYLICGVDEADIIADYQVTETYQEKNPMFAKVPESIRFLMNSKAENMKEFLKSAKEKDYLKLLSENGLKEKMVFNIKDNIIEK